jgi:hypothetical protein
MPPAACDSPLNGLDSEPGVEAAIGSGLPLPYAIVARDILVGIEIIIVIIWVSAVVEPYIVF